MHNQIYRLSVPYIYHNLDEVLNLFFLGNKHHYLHLYFYITFFLHSNLLSDELQVKHYNHLFQVIEIV
jgi:hypothetical protein